MLRKPLTWLLLFVVSTVLAACCGSVPCDCQDSLDDALFFYVNVDSTATGSGRGFDSREATTIRIVRQAPVDSGRAVDNAGDTITITRLRSEVGQPIIINNNQPFVSAGANKLSAYNYVIFVGIRQPARYTVESIQLQDEQVSDGCCSCNRNFTKRIVLNGKLLDLTDPDGQDKPVPVTLSR